MNFPTAVGFRAYSQTSLDGVEGLPVDDGLVGALHPIPLVLRNINQDFRFVADLLTPTLNHGACIHLIVEDSPNRSLVPEAIIIFHRMITGPASFRLIPGRAWNPLLIEHIGDVLLAVTFQGPLKNLADYLSSLWVNDDVIFVSGVLLVSIDGEAADVLSFSTFQVKNHADVFGEVLQVPLIDQAVDLTGFFVAFDLCVGVVGHGDEADAPDGKQAVNVLFHQLHVPGEAGLGLTEDDLELLLFRRRQHSVKVRAEAVSSGVVLVAVDGVDVPAMVNGVAGQQGFLVLNALRFDLVFVFILLTQAYIDCTENLLHLLEGVTAHL